MIKKEYNGVVIQNILNKTATVITEYKFKHPKYYKIITRHKKYMIHDEQNLCKIGNKVSFITSRPYSKKKRWILNKIF